MRLVSFTVLKYRSIKTAHKIKVGARTVLVGPNNEGKSNLIRALVTGMRVLTAVRAQPPWLKPRPTRLPSYRSLYDWERDYPVELQPKDIRGESEITLEFLLSDEEVQEFVQEIKSNLNGTSSPKNLAGSARYVFHQCH